MRRNYRSTSKVHRDKILKSGLYNYISYYMYKINTNIK
jgi:hypothetical protein